MSKGPRALLIVTLALFIVFAICATMLMTIPRSTPPTQFRDDLDDQSDPSIPDPVVTDLQLLDFSLVDQDSQPFTLEDLKGHVTVVNFIFTHCRLICPAMTDTVRQIADRVKGTDCRFVSFSIDPQHDSPARLRSFAQAYDPDFSRWKFVTGFGVPGAEQTVSDMLTKGLLTALSTDPSDKIDLQPGITSPDGSPARGQMDTILHTEKLFLIGRNGYVLGVYSSNHESDVDRLVRRIQRLCRPL